MITLKRLPLLSYAALFGGVTAAGFAIVRTSHFADHPRILSLALTLDIAVFLPCAYLFLAWKMKWPLVTAVPVFLLSLVAAHWVLPAENESDLALLELALGPLEAAAILFLVIKTRRVAREYRNRENPDFLEALEIALGRVINGTRVLQVLLTEICVVYYGLFAWRKKPSRPAGAAAFTYHKKSGYGMLAGVLIFVIAVETSLLHFLLKPHVPLLAWLLTALSLYGVIFILADLNAARLRPIHMDARSLAVRVGLRWRCRIPLSDIAGVEAVTLSMENREGFLNGVLVGNGNVILILSRPAFAVGFYGMRKRFDRIALAVDDAGSFLSALKARGIDGA